jgi:uncharacterized protein YhaN
MRFDEIAIERYGAFESRALTLPKTGLAVIYGPNEAGKSTTLSAIGDFLFGVPPRTSRGAVFGNDAIRIQGTLSRADGSSLTLRRRKGNVRTLTDGDNAVVEEAALAALLGPTNRDRFETLFGLDHERLRRGGERLLQADGEIGRLIVEAGGGLSALVARLKAIDAEIDRLFAPRRSADRAFYKALDAFEGADREAKEGLVTREKHDAAHAAQAAAKAEEARLGDERRALVLALSALERTARVIPLLRALDQAEQSLAAIEAPTLPEAFDADVLTATAALTQAEAALAAAEAASEVLDARLAAIGVDDRLVAAEAAIRDAAERATHLAKQRDDRPNRLKELGETSAKLDGLRRQLGLGPAEDLGPRLPPEEAVRAVGGLAGAAQRRAPAIDAARKGIAEAEAEIAALDLRIAAELRAGRGASVGVSTAEIAALPGAIAIAETKRAQGAAAEAGAEAAARALDFADVAALEALSCPDPDWLARAVARAEAAETERLRQATLRADAETRRDVARSDVARLDMGREVASETSLAAARQVRSEAWSPIREAHLSGQASGDPAKRRAEADALETALANADDIADRRAAEAERAAGLAQAKRRLSEATAAAEAAGRALEAIEMGLAEARAERAAAFPDADARAPGLTALKALAERRRDILTGSREARALLRDAESARAQLSGPLAALDFAERACGLSPQPTEPVAQRVRTALAAVERHDRAHAEHLRDLAAREKAAARLAAERRQLAGLEAEETVWREAWGPSVRRLGLDATASADEAAAAAVEWSGARGVMTALDLIRDRIGKMDRDEADLSARVAAIGEVTGVELPEDSVAAARMLFAHFTETDGRRRDRETLAPDAREAALVLERRRGELDERRAEIARLAEAAGVAADDAAGLAEVAKRHAERRSLAREIARLTDSLATAGDGRPISDLRQAAAGRDLDEVRANAEAMAGQVRRTDEAHHDAIRAEHDARASLDALAAQEGVNRAIVARESATAELHEAAERYVELSLARDLVNEAIQKVRAERQDPLVARAGELFALATRGAFSGVGADVDDSGQPVVVGRRADGRSVHVGAMSDGTRDQLFLAFRLASLESYCRAAEPLPFVADDVLVHFDDERSRATLDLLAEFASVTQVLLFTHHAGVRDMGAALASEGRCGLVEIGG